MNKSLPNYDKALSVKDLGGVIVELESDLRVCYAKVDALNPYVD